MKKTLFAITVTVALSFMAGRAQTPQTPRPAPQKHIVTLDQALDAIISPDAQVEILVDDDQTRLTWPGSGR